MRDVCTPESAEVTPSEADETLAIAAYLRIDEMSAEVQAIVSLSESTNPDLMSGRHQGATKMRGHIDTAAALIERLNQARPAAMGVDDRGASAEEWLHSARIPTSRGIKSPFEILADTSLAMDALGELLR